MACVLRILMVVAIATLCAACGKAPPPLSHDAYVWQRQWTPALREALQSSRDLVRDWRVLAAQADRDGHFRIFTPDRDALARSGRPVILVVRIDGRLATFDEAALVADVLAVVHGGPGLPAGIEIDYDCPTARLPAYTAFLGRLRHELGSLPLSITALPTWNDSPALDGLLAVPDEAVLQVHAVQAPQAGLFDPQVAQGWITAFARHTHKPFRVALPTYGSRVSWDADGSLLAVESESAALAAGAVSAELYASPAIVREVVVRLDRDRPPGLVGIVWFRLPTTDDERAWSLSSWRGVVSGQLDIQPVRAHLRAGKGASAPADVLLDNPGGIDAAAPSIVSLPDACELADGIDGYVLRRGTHSLELVAERARPLPAHTQRSIGWARCKAGTPDDLSLSAQGAPVS